MSEDSSISLDAEPFALPQPTLFSSLEEASSELEGMLNQLRSTSMDLEAYEHGIAVSNAEQRLLFSPRLANWEQAFSVFLATQSSALTSEDRKDAMILKANHLLAEILAAVNPSPGEFGWNVFEAKFAAIVDLAAAVLGDSEHSGPSATDAGSQTGEPSETGSTATLSPSLGIFDPLYEVCARCYDPVLRRRALDLMIHHPTQAASSASEVRRVALALDEQSAESWSQSPPAE